MQPKRNCRYCGKELPTRLLSTRKQFCNDVCRKAQQKRRNNPLGRQCRCGVELLQRYTRFCSDTCREAYRDAPNKCTHCGEALTREPGKAPKQFCNDVCRAAHHVRHCRFCGEALHKKSAQFCNEKCRGEHAKKKRAARREKAHEQGLCKNCCYQPATIGTQCKSCHDSMVRVEENRKHGIFVRSKTRGRRTKAQKTYWLRKGAGICTRCGVAPPMADSPLCAPCRDTRNTELRKYADKYRRKAGKPVNPNKGPRVKTFSVTTAKLAQR